MELSSLIPELHLSRSAIGFVVSTILAGGAVASPQSVDPVAEGDDEAATILDGEVPQTTSAPRVFGVTEAPEIDGVLEEIWKDGTLLADTWRQVDPDEGALPTQRTEVRLMRDSRNLYVGVRCFDDEPSKIVSRVMIRGGPINRDDNIMMVLDPKRDLRTGYIFRINPNGTRADARLVNGRSDYNWDGQWYGRSAIDAEGWTAEFVVPFRTISIDEDNLDWGINFERDIRRNNETIRWQAADRDVRVTSVADAGVVEMFGDIDQGSGIDVRPYGKITAQEDDGTDVSGTGGVDVFWKITPGLTFVGTVNPDFAETEVDQRVINFSRFSIRFPEKRDFFLEDAGYFDFGGIRSTPLPFYSRRIGLSPQGEPQTILGGVKLTGSIEDVSVGILDTQMDDEVSPAGRNYFAGRALFNVFEQSSIGVIATNGNPLGPESNSLLGTDFNFLTTDLAGGRTLSGNAWFQQTFTGGEEDSDATAMGARISYPNDILNWRLGWARIGSDYFPALGFVQRTGIHELFGGGRYRWRPDSSLVRTIDLGVGGFMVTNLDLEIESMDLEFDVPKIQFDRGDEIYLEYGIQQEVPTQDFLVANQLLVPAGNYTWSRIEAGFETTSKEPVEIGGSAAWSGYYGGSRTTVSGNLRWQPAPSLLIAGAAQWNDIRLDTGRLETWLVSSRVNFYFTPEISWENLIQYDTQSGTVGVNSRLRWAFRDGQEIFVVFNQNVEADDLDFTIDTTELIAKIGWTFSF